MGRLARNTGLLIPIGVLCITVAGAPAARAPTLFRVTLAATAYEKWTYSAPPSEDGSCQTTETSEGIRTAKFRTTGAAVVRVVDGRVLPTDLGGITGTVSLGGSNTTDETCGGVGIGKISDCASSKQSFAGAKVRVDGPRPGVLAVGPVRNLRLGEADCPFEPGEVRRRPLGPVPGPLRLPPEGLASVRIARITLRGSATLRTTYASPETGHLDERAEWTLTFVRVQP